MNDKLPEGVVLEMRDDDDKPHCLSCYFLPVKRKCPKEWSAIKCVFTLSCVKSRNVYFKELGASNDN